MRIAVIGAGYVGLVTAAALAELGHRVASMDRDQRKIAALKGGAVPFHEPGLENLVRRNVRRRRLAFYDGLSEALRGSRVVFLCVGTPPKKNGEADLSQVWSAARSLGKKLDHSVIVATKSTVPVGTNRKLAGFLRSARVSVPVIVASVPEFLREGSAVRDFFHPDRVVIGCEDSKTTQTLMAAFRKIQAPKVVTTLESAEMIKYASNAFLATKISFINEIANLCERVGADVEVVARGMGLDTRIGSAFLKAGIGYGGSCFPKDVRALHQIAGTHQYRFRLLKAVIEVNRAQRELFFKKIQRAVGGSLRGKKIAVFGLAFKANTDDVRESAALDIIRLLLRAGARVRAYDPVAEENAREVLSQPSLVYHASAYKAARGADAVVITTEWEEFRSLRWGTLRKLMRQPIIVDGKNLLAGVFAATGQFRYYSVGKGKGQISV